MIVKKVRPPTPARGGTIRKPNVPGRVVARPRVTLGVPKSPIFVGSYVRVGVGLKGTAIPFEKLRFQVAEGARGGVVSSSRDESFRPEKPHVLLCAGYAPGSYRLQAYLGTTNTLVAEAPFRLDALWKDEDLGPSKWFSGITKGYHAGSAWGGGPGGIQNVSVVPALGTRRIAILLVDTSTQRYSTNAATVQGYQTRLMDEIINGVNDNGVMRSARQFYREVSYGNFDLSAQVFGPVNLPGTFDDYFNADGSPRGGYYQACVTAGDALINYTQFDTLLCVSQSVTGAAPRRAWPYASIGQWGPYTTGDGNVNLGVISMPYEWGTATNREFFETFCHELGHNLGLGDLYSPSVPGRNPGNWEMMHGDDAFPHFSLANRLMLGWVPAGWVEGFNFQSMAAPVNQVVTLDPIENGAPAVGHRTGVEVRLADGWNYYFEYRIRQGTQIADQNLPSNDRVLGTDVVSPPYSPPIARPGILLLNNDVDGDGAVLGNAQDYEETDSTDPVYPTDFKVEVSGIDGNKADVRVKYGVNSRPDPSIRPWPASADRPWQSPDIEIRNARSQADAQWANVPWVGNTNTIVARVKNNGSLDAPQVLVNFFVRDYNTGGVPETFLGSDRRDVAAGATVEFTGTWTPPSTGHYCIVVRIPLYQLPANPAVVEMTELNNVAQSNYDRFVSGTASPPRRRVTSVTVGNPYHERTRIWIHAGNSNPLYRTYLETSWLYLDPGQTRRVRVMYEYAPDHLSLDLYPTALRTKYRGMQKVPNRVALTTYVEDPRDRPRHALMVLGGAEAEIVTGADTKFRRFTVDGRAATGMVVALADGTPVKSGKVIVRQTVGRAPNAQVDYVTVSVKAGAFAAKLRLSGGLARAFYVPAAGYADCESEDRSVK